MAPNTTPTKRAKICTMRAVGYSNDEIWAALTGRHELSNWQICHIVKRYGGKENYYEEGHSTGHPRKLSSRDVQNACRHLSNQTAHDALDLQRKYFPVVSVDTVKQALWQEGLEPHIWHRVPFISHKNLHVRKSWAEEQLEWTVNKLGGCGLLRWIHILPFWLWWDGMVLEEARTALGLTVYEEEG